MGVKRSQRGTGVRRVGGHLPCMADMQCTFATIYYFEDFYRALDEILMLSGESKISPVLVVTFVPSAERGLTPRSRSGPIRAINSASQSSVQRCTRTFA